MADKEYPKEYPCPNCGSTRRWIGELYKEEITKGKASDDIPAGTAVLQAAVLDPRRPQLTCPVAIFIEDVCMDCGITYTCSVDVKQGQPMMNIQGPGIGKGKNPFGLPPGAGLVISSL